MNIERLQIDCDVTVEAPMWIEAIPDIENLCKVIATKTLTKCWPGPFTRHLLEITEIEISIVLSDDKTVQGLNSKYRNKHSPTNVLSFAALENDPNMIPPAGMPLLLGDIILAYETAATEADTEDKTLANHLSHLVIHGILHLLGYDHETETEARQMETLEISVLDDLDIENPYQHFMVEGTP